MMVLWSQLSLNEGNTGESDVNDRRHYCMSGIVARNKRQTARLSHECP